MRRTGGWVILVCLVASAPGRSARREVTVAAAANLADVFQAMAPEFERSTGIHPVFSFGSTAQLALQIEHAAPYDVFAAADSEHVAELDRKGMLEPRSRAVYATGVLALWIPPASAAGIDRIEDLASPRVKVVAVARPELAPYGQAAIETLTRLGVMERVKPKIVYAGNISAAKQYGSSGNADAVFTALSLVMKEGGRVIRVPEDLHQPITQSLAVLAGSHDKGAAQAFTAFLLQGKGREMLASFGYQTPR